MILLGRRKRKQVTPKRVKRVPKIFTCPECGEKSVKVEKTNRTKQILQEDGEFKNFPIATVKCGNCESTKDVLMTSISEPVDAFGDYIDFYYADQEMLRLEKRVQKLEEDRELGDLVLSYSILSDLCVIKVEILSEEENPNIEEINRLKSKAREYKNLEMIRLKELDAEDRGIRTEEESLFTESETKIKKERKIDDIFDDPGFLEF